MASTEKPDLSDPPTPKGKRTRAHLLSAARQVFSRAGYVTLRMSDVAEAAGVSMGALYRYFRSKDDMFLALIGDIHNDLYLASRSQGVKFSEDPYAALLAANEGYLNLYHTNRDVMRAFIEATTVNTAYRDMWWWMRQRHIERFVAMLERDFGITEVNGIPARVITEALASMTEQSAYVWYAQEQLSPHAVPVRMAAQVIARAWHDAFFGSTGAPARQENQRTELSL